MEGLSIPPLVKINSEWNKDNCGGAFNFGGAWRKNPQFYLKYLNEGDVPVKVEIILKSEETKPNAITPYIGFYVFKATTDGPKKIMKISKGTVMKITEFQIERRVAQTCKLIPRQGLIIMPTTFEPSINHKFSLSIAGLTEPQLMFYTNIG
jgi:hypothetical protein